MPKCVKCLDYFHPDMCVVVDEKDMACRCVFCHIEKQEITVENEDGSPSHTVTKKEAIYNYKKYIQDLKESDKVQNILGKEQENPFKI